MASERMEWIEIIEPRTKEHMYANLTTGECVWDAPIGVPVKKTDNNQWWELFDQNTSRFYYYNATSQKTVWHRPTNCDIIPLAKLQTLKQNTEPLDSSTQATQTPTSNTKDVVSATMTTESSSPISMNSIGGGGGSSSRSSTKAAAARAGGVQRLATSETQTSPLSSPRPARRSHHHHHHHHHKQQQQIQQQSIQQQLKPVQPPAPAKEKESEKARSQSIEGELGRPRRGSQGSWYSHNARNQDNHTSDSGCVSMSRTSLDSPNHGGGGGQLLPPSSTAPANHSAGLSTSTSTPQLKKKPLSDANHQLSPAAAAAAQLPVKSSAVLVHRSASNASAHHPPPSKQKSFDVDISVGGGYSLGHENRSSGGGTGGAGGRGGRSLLPSSLSNNQLSLSRSQSFAQRTAQQQAQQQAAQQQNNASSQQLLQQATSEQSASTMPLTSTLSLDQEEEDSMHEKYFAPGGHLAPASSQASSSTGRRSVESTPQARRKHHHHHHHHHHHRCPKLSPDYANLVPPPPTRSSSSNSSTLAPREGGGREVRRGGPGSGGGSSSGREQRAISKAGSRDDGLSSSENEPPADDDDDVSSSLSSSPPVNTNPPAPLQPLPLPLDNSASTESGAVVSKRIANHHQQKSVPASSPIYSNQPSFIPESHILPLQQYILEQAKLSGCYRFGDSLAEEADSSLQSDDEDGGGGGGTNGGGGGGRGGRGGGGLEYDSDEFADDEAMSNQDDSSSQEYLHDEPSYLDTLEEHYSQAQARLTYIPESRMAASSGYNSNLASLTSHHRTNNHLPPVPGSHCLGGSTTVPLETQHASLKRKKDPPAIPPVLYSPIMERAERFLGLSSRRTTPSPPLIYRTPSNPHSLPSSPSPLSATVQLDQLSRVVLNRDKKLPSESDIEKYAQDNLNIHKKGIFRKKFSVRDMLSWSKDPIRKPMLVHLDKALKKDATELFKLVQTYMSDRKAKVGMTLNSVALEICAFGYAKPALRDEIYIQICRQTTENPRRESLRRGWELLAICLSFFPPSPKFQAYLDGYMNRHRDPSFDFPEIGKWPIHVQVSHYASVSCKRLERGGVGGKRPPRKPTLDEIDQARIQIFRPSMFGSTLEEVMAMQRERFPHCKLPWIQTTLSEEVLRLQGAQTEGIFRVSADVDEVVSLKQAVDRWERPTECTDAHTPASLLKLWYRELYEPLIPDSVYADCIQFHDDAQRVLLIVDTLPEINRLVLSYLVRFLQIFARPEVVAQTKMDASNLAMVMAPNCLRCTSHDPRVIFDNARKEMAFMHTLIQCLDTSFMDNMGRSQSGSSSLQDNEPPLN